MIAAFNAVLHGEGSYAEVTMCVATVVQTALFTYAVVSGLVAFLRSVLFRSSGLWWMMRFGLTCFAVIMFFAPVLENKFCTEMLEQVWRQMNLSLLPSAVRDSTGSSLHRILSATHVFSMILGTAACHYIKSSIRPGSAVPARIGGVITPASSATFTRWGLLFNAWYMLGAYVWFTFFFELVLDEPKVQGLVGGANVLVLLRTANTNVMIWSHMLAYFIGFHAHDIHFHRGLHLATEAQAYSYYFIRFGLVAVIPTLAGLPGLSFEYEHMLRMALMWVIVAFKGGEGITLEGLAATVVTLGLGMVFVSNVFDGARQLPTLDSAVVAPLCDLVVQAYRTIDQIPQNAALVALSIVILVLVVFSATLHSRLRSLEKQPVADLAEQAQEVARQKNRLATAPPCPVGWYTVAFSSALKNGDVKMFHCAGVDLCVFRDEEGEAHVTDAYCPHLGANVAQGKVKGKCIECPFHLWQFDGKTGECTDIHYTDRAIPKVAKLFAWPTMEWAGRVMFFYHPSRVTEPIFHPESDDMFIGYVEEPGQCTSFNSHMQEIMENCSDPVHFEVLHSQPAFPLIKRWSKVTHNITCVDKGFTLDFYNTPKVRLFGIWLPDHADVHVTYYGVSLMRFRFNIAGLGTANLVKSFTQITPTVVQQYDMWYFDPRYPRFLRAFLKRAARVAFEEDYIAWNHKVFLKAPLLVQGDGDVMRRRRWMKQFFVDMEW